MIHRLRAMDMARHVPLTAVSQRLRDGFFGVRQTVGHMRRLVTVARKLPAIRSAAVSVIYLQPERDEHAEVAALFEFVRDRIRYTRDICDIETLHDPERVLATRVGDCDDQSTLLAALLESVGYPTRFVVAGYADETPQHVYLQVQLDDEWVDLDPTEYGQVGDAPPDPVSIWHEEV